MPDVTEMKRCEALAEKAYSDMYDAAPHNVKDCYEDARRGFAEAIRIARLLERMEDVARLDARIRHLDAVYNSQFRYAGR